MKVILLESIAKLGQLGDSVEVKAGYARNFLIPQQKAVRVTAEALAAVESRRAELVKEEKERLDVAKARADTAIRQLTIQRRVIDDEGRLFGSVSIGDIVDAAAEQGTEILRSEVDMPDGNIKNTGEYQVHVNIHPEISFEIDVAVVADDLVPSLAETMDAADEAEASASESAADEPTDAEGEGAEAE